MRSLALATAFAMALALSPAAGAHEHGPEPHDHGADHQHGGDEHGPSTRDASPLPSFNESGGCGDLQGVRGPYATHRSQNLGSAEPVRGPWGDFYGRTIGSVRSQLVAVHLPMSEHDHKVFWVHERVAPALEMVADNLRAEQANGRHYTIRTADSGSFRPSTVNPGRHMSFHTVGAAIDINAQSNPYRADNALITDMPDWFVKAWTDAGWCWGGHWQEIKDTMHFSWMGPAHTPGYEAPPPQAPVTRLDRRFRTELALETTGAGIAEGTTFVADLDRDGAADIARVGPATLAGHAAITWSMAHHGYDSCAWSITLPVRPTDAEQPLVDDFTGDGRADLAFADTAGPTVRLVIHDWSAIWAGDAIETAVPVTGVLAISSGDIDADGHADLLVHRLRNGREKIEVWRGPDYDLADAKRRVRDPVAGGRVATGDFDLDGHHDAWVLAPDGRLQVMFGPDFGRTRMRRTHAAPRAGERFFVADYDGDGRRDMWLVGPDMSARVHLGSRTLSASNRDWWFVDDTDHWVSGEGCAPPAADPTQVIRLAPFGDEGFAVARNRPTPRHAVILYSSPGTQAWVAELKGEAIDVTAEDDMVFDLASVNGRARLTALDSATGNRLWVRGVNRKVTTHAMWASGDGVTLVGTHADRPGVTLLYTIAKGRLQGRERVKGFEATHAVNAADGTFLLGRGDDGGSVIGLVESGGVTTVAGVDGEPAWIGMAGDVLAVIAGATVHLFEGQGATWASTGQIDLGDVLAVAAHTASDGDVFVAVRRSDGSNLLQRIDGATAAITTLRNLPFHLEPADLFVRDTNAFVGLVRIADHSWSVSYYGV